MPKYLSQIIQSITGTGFFLALLVFSACHQEKEHLAPAIYARDSASVMTSYGINTLISDSGVIKYRIVTERWDVNTVRHPQKWSFEKGIFFEKFDEKFHVQLYLQADTAWFYNEHNLWELRGRVRVRNVEGLVFTSEELYYDGDRHELYSNKFSRLVTPERTLQGTYFRSDERMEHYTVSNSKGSFITDDMDKQQPVATTPAAAAGDTSQQQQPIREMPVKHAAYPKPITPTNIK